MHAHRYWQYQFISVSVNVKPYMPVAVEISLSFLVISVMQKRILESICWQNIRLNNSNS